MDSPAGGADWVHYLTLYFTENFYFIPCSVTVMFSLVRENLLFHLVTILD
jgi:hypothetical protein